MQDKINYIDLYCERLNPGIFAEPLNAITNLAFIGIGLFILKGPSFAGRILGVVTILVGFGSLTFHTLATPWAANLDVGFIALYILMFAYLVPLKLWNLSILLTMIFTILVLSLVILFNLLSPYLKNWLGHFPPGIYVGAWLSLLIYTIISKLYKIKVAVRWLTIATFLFPISLTARELDLNICDIFPYGTHWLWHLLNSLVLGLCCWAFHAEQKSQFNSITRTESLK
ncbi:MAG: hypothetical protein EB044_03375 [Actinobacteria bacterium]|jgi:hypothetical protein|nr:hypothetical protein [Candidatus Fonsibacter ubiquis]NDA39252.1 hypothetical protein [Actinomycetota bacterium]NCU62031.1 hypothetical protein [Candidatus Fonsibacter ubiquis]NCU74783.1 hypothetical protein [Candidatus Fonsibacter ubiquis]NDE12932.1 hypothetical protein [Actinomycetota bacterium]